MKQEALITLVLVTIVAVGILGQNSAVIDGISKLLGL